MPVWTWLSSTAPDLFEGGCLLNDFLKKVLCTQNVRFAGEQGDNDEISRHDGGACRRRHAPATVNDDHVIFPPEWFDFLMEIACRQTDGLYLGLAGAGPQAGPHANPSAVNTAVQQYIQLDVRPSMKISRR